MLLIIYCTKIFLAKTWNYTYLLSSNVRTSSRERSHLRPPLVSGHKVLTFYEVAYGCTVGSIVLRTLENNSLNPPLRDYKNTDFMSLLIVQV